MRLDTTEQAMLGGECGSAAKWAMELQVRIGSFFDAEDFVGVRMVHLPSDIEVVGPETIAFFNKLAELPQSERIPRALAIVDARGFDTAVYSRLLPGRELSSRMDAVIDSLARLGAMPTHAAANYHSIPPVAFGEHCAFSGTPGVICANSLQGARSNFEAGAAAVAAMFTGRVPRYGFHLDAGRQANRRFVIECEPKNATEWGAIGAIIGRRVGSYWGVPLLESGGDRPGTVELNHLGVALASFGSIGMYHLSGVTPEASQVAAAGLPAETVTRADLDSFFTGWGSGGGELDLVVLGAPQLGLAEMQTLAAQLEGKHLHPRTTLLAYTSQEMKALCVRTGIADVIQEAGAHIVFGQCFFQIFARDVGTANHWVTLMTQSVKMANLTAGFGYRPVPASLERCIESALAGRML